MSTSLILLSEFQKTEIELWLPTEWDGYDVSSLGRVRSWRIVTVRGRGLGRGTASGRRKEPYILKLVVDDSGRFMVRFSDGKLVKKIFSVHRLVAKAFIPNPNNLPWVNHVTVNHKDNRAGNLEWSDPKRNSEHASRYGLLLKGEANNASKLTEAGIRNARMQRQQGVTLCSLASALGVTPETLRKAMNGKTWRHLDG